MLRFATTLGLSATPLQSLAAVALDTETTGLDVAKDRIIEIAAIPILAAQDGPYRPFQSLVDPGVPVPADATRIHGITTQMLRGAPAFAGIAEDIGAWLRDLVIVGYSIGFDVAVLKAEFARAGLAWTAPRTLDVRHLIALLGPELPDHSLETVAGWLGLEVEARHRAEADARLAAAVFEAVLPRLADKQVRTLGEAERAIRQRVNLAAAETGAGWTASRDPDAVDLRAELATIDSFPYRHRVADLMHTPVQTADPDCSVAEALSRLMAEQVSSVFVDFGATGGQGRYGIITERDILRAIDRHGDKVLGQPVGRFASRPLQTVAQDEFVYRALTGMANAGFRHLGVRDADGGLVGALSARDLLRQRAGDAALLGQQIDRAGSVEDMGRVWSSLTTVAASLYHEDVDPRTIAAVVSRELQALTRRSGELALKALPAAGATGSPDDFALLILGSGGRGESLLAMDQDNALIVSDALSAQVDAAFARFGQAVADNLNAAGVPYCKGGIMAASDSWRKTESGWRKTVSTWIGRTSPEDILGSDIFFDAISVLGNKAMADALLKDAAASARNAPPFLSALARNATDFDVPVGFFGRLKTVDGRVDLKKGGLMPIFSAARTAALRHGVFARSTVDRIQGLRDQGAIPPALALDLSEAHRIFLGAILGQQLRDIAAGLMPGNTVSPADLSRFRRDQLKWALGRMDRITDLVGVPAGF